MNLVKTTAAALVAAIPATFAAADYIQLIDLPTINGGDGAQLRSSVIDDTVGYALLGNAPGAGGQYRVVKIDDIGGANVVTTLASSGDFDTAKGSALADLSGTIFDGGTQLYVLDTRQDEIYTISKATGAVTLLADNASIGGSVTFGALDPTDGDLAYYQSSDDNAQKTLGTLNGTTVVLTDTELAAITGDDTPSGLGIDNDGIFYFGQGTSSAGENIYFYDPDTDASGTLLTEEQLVGIGNDVSFSTTAFTVEDNVIIFRDGGTNDSFKTVDIDGGNTVAVLLDETQLVNGPAASDFAQDFSIWQEQFVSWTQTLTAGGQIAGIYAIPEPASLALVGLGGLAMLRRRSA